MMPTQRNRTVYALFTTAIIGIGLFSRSRFIPALIYPYLGDFLYTVMFYLIIGFLFPKMPPIKVASWSIGICFFIEIAQLYQAPWIVEVRSYKFGGLILGYGFLWSDLVSYTLGGLCACLVERWINIKCQMQGFGFKISHRYPRVSKSFSTAFNIPLRLSSPSFA